MKHETVEALMRMNKLRDAIQVDPGQRGLGRDPVSNLLNQHPHDFADASMSLARAPKPVVAIVTGFHILAADAPETDGPFGAVKLAEVLHHGGAQVALYSEKACAAAMADALQRLQIDALVPVVEVPRPGEGEWPERPAGLTHLIAIERPGPAHTPASISHQPGATSELLAQFMASIPEEDWDQYHNAKGHNITKQHAPLHRWFESVPSTLFTIGIGDGGNEIGMGRIAWDVLRRNIPEGGRIACRIATHATIVTGVSNWGGYALAATFAWLRGLPDWHQFFNAEQHQQLWQAVLQSHRLVDAGSRECRLRVDGLTWEAYIRLFEIIRSTLDAR